MMIKAININKYLKEHSKSLNFNIFFSKLINFIILEWILTIILASSSFLEIKFLLNMRGYYALLLLSFIDVVRKELKSFLETYAEEKESNLLYKFQTGVDILINAFLMRNTLAITWPNFISLGIPIIFSLTALLFSIVLYFTRTFEEDIKVLDILIYSVFIIITTYTINNLFLKYNFKFFLLAIGMITLISIILLRNIKETIEES